MQRGCCWIAVGLTLLLLDPVAAWTPAPCYPVTVPDNFMLVFGSTNSALQPSFTFWMSPVAAATPTVISDPTNTLLSVRPSCNDEVKGISTYHGSTGLVPISMFSSTEGGTGFSALKIMSACAADRGAVLYNVLHDKDAFTYSVTATNGTVLGFGPEENDSVFTLYDGATKSTLLVTATQKYGQFPLQTPLASYAYGAQWNVSIVNPAAFDGTGMSRSAILFALSMKSNQEMTCFPVTPEPSAGPASSSPISPGWVVGISLVLSVLAAMVVYLLFRRYYRQQDYAQMRVMMNENHES